jgi:predicted nucleic acid-binding protein
VITFIDTGFLIALALKDDALHQRAMAWNRSLIGRCITTEFILLETADAMAAPALRAAAGDLIDRLRQDRVGGVGTDRRRISTLS